MNPEMMKTDWTDFTASKKTSAVIKKQKMFMNNHGFTPSVCSHIISDNTEVAQWQVMVI